MEKNREKRNRRRGRICWHLAVVAMMLLAPAQAWAQGPRLQLDNLSRLAAQATEAVDVTVDPALLQIAAAFLSSQKPDEAAIKELIGGLKGIYVKVFEFDREGVYTEADVEAVRKQLKSPRWSRIVNVQSKQQGETVEVYLWREGEQTGGVAIMAVEPKELTIVNIVGQIDLAKLAALQGRFGIPQLPLDGREKPPEPK